MAEPETPEAPEPAPAKPARASRTKPAAKPEPDDPGINASITDQGMSTAGREVDPDDPGINANVVF